MTGGPYRNQDEEKNRLQIVERLIYTMSPRTIWTQVVILSFLMLGTLWEAHDMVTPRVEVRVHERIVYRTPRVRETLEQHRRYLKQDRLLCERACEQHLVAVEECHWRAGGVRSCNCACDSGHGDRSDVREQR